MVRFCNACYMFPGGILQPHVNFRVGGLFHSVPYAILGSIPNEVITLAGV